MDRKCVFEIARFSRAADWNPSLLDKLNPDLLEQRLLETTASRTDDISQGRLKTSPGFAARGTSTTSVERKTMKYRASWGDRIWLGCRVTRGKFQLDRINCGNPSEPCSVEEPWGRSGASNDRRESTISPGLLRGLHFSTSFLTPFRGLEPLDRPYMFFTIGCELSTRVTLSCAQIFKA